jgi:hypothetical protein
MSDNDPGPATWHDSPTYACYDCAHYLSLDCGCQICRGRTGVSLFRNFPFQNTRCRTYAPRPGGQGWNEAAEQEEYWRKNTGERRYMR